jgi:hypothetical protein
VSAPQGNSNVNVQKWKNNELRNTRFSCLRRVITLLSPRVYANSQLHNANSERTKDAQIYVAPSTANSNMTYE